MRKVLKITLYIICSIIFILLCGVVYLNTPGGQNFVRGKAEAYLKNKLKTEVRIGHLGYGLPKFIVLNDVLFLDQAKDTLLAAGELKIDLNMLKLIHKNVDVQQLVFKGVHSHIYRNLPDTTYNFSYIITAFTGNNPKAPKKAADTGSSLNIALDRIKFDDIHIRFDDYTGGMRLAVNLDHLDLKMKKLDLDHMLFHIKELTVSGFDTKFSQDTSYLPKSTDTTKADFQLIADNVNLDHFAFQYNNSLNKILFDLRLGTLQLQLKKFGLADNRVDIKKLAMKNSSIVLDMGKLATPPSFIDTLVKKDTTEGWYVTASNMDIAGVNFKMDDENSPLQPYGMDYSHLGFQNMVMTMNNFLYTSDTIAGDIRHFTGKEQCGFDVRELRTVFNYNPQGATLSKLYLQTPNTILQDHIEVHYPSLTALQKRSQLMQLNINLKNSILGLQDVLVFVPQLRTQQIFKKYKNGHFNLEANINGLLNNLNIAHFYAAGMGSTEILLNGRLSGLPEPKDISYNLHISKFQSSAKDISELVPDSVLSPVRLPDRFGITGQIAGTEMDYKTDLYFASTDGRAYIKGMLAMSPGKNKERYDMVIRTDQLNVGRILKKDSLMGMVTLTMNIKGQSFDFKTMTASVDGAISSAMLKGYRYHDVTLNGNVAAKQGDISLTSADSNLRLQLKGHGDFNGKYAAVKADINIDSIDFQALKLYSSEFRARGLIHADFPELNPDYPRGTFSWLQPVINANGKRYYLDSMYVISRPSEDTGQNIIANLDVMQATITGKTPLTKIGNIIQEHINRHYAFPPTDSTKNSFTRNPSGTSLVATNQRPKDTTQIPGDYDLHLMAHVIDKPMLHSILPGLTSFDSIHIDGTLTPRNLGLNVLIPNVEYGPTTIQNGVIQLRGTDSAFTYKLTVDQISQKSLALYYADIHGNLDQNTITTNISLSDGARKERFALAASMTKSGDTQIVVLQPGLKLNYNAWDVAQPNRIVLANGGFYIQNFSISNGGQYIKANSATPQINTPLKIDITNFLLSNITDVISAHDTLLANGILGGIISIDRITPSPQITSDLQILDLSVLGDTLGNLQLQVNNKQENVLDTKLKLNGQGNDISLTGSYFTQPTDGNDFNFNLDINALAVHSFETIAMNQIRNSSGFLRGNLKMQGTPSAPLITGELRTDNLITNISQLNATFKMPAEKIEFTNNNISFNNFTLHDSADNKAVLGGSINTGELTNPQLDLTVNAKNWRALHSTAKDNKEFYGDLLLTTNLVVKGTPSAPKIDGSLNILKGTNFTIVTPESNPEIESSQGIVVFVNMKDTGRRNVLVPKRKDSTKHKLAAGSDINVNITVDKSAQFTLIIDQASGDFLNVKGEASLNAAVTPGGIVTLTGNYDLHGGAYQLNYNFIKRKFIIKDGSTITFGGDPVKGTTLDVTAVYTANVPPYDLIQREVPDPAQLNYYKQRLPFDIDLHMKGAVLTPALTFDIVLPDNKVYPLSADQVETIQGKLNQVRMDTADLNKQVFAVLILGRFVSDDPFSSGASSTLSNTALQSVSTFIGEQLNQAAGKLVKGVDISADLATTDDYTTGSMQQRTDLNLAASKTLLNDRLKLTIGNDFELEGPQTTNNQNSALVPSNLAADYLLSADGKYTVRAYRKAYDEGVLQGFVTETGVNFIVSLDYDHFKNVFQKRKKESSNAKTN